MNDALVVANTTKAKVYLTDTAQRNYGDAFDALASAFREIIPTYSAAQTVSDRLDRVQLVVHRTIDGVNYAFILQFVLGRDGVWRLLSM